MATQKTRKPIAERARRTERNISDLYDRDLTQQSFTDDAIVQRPGGEIIATLTSGGNVPTVRIFNNTTGYTPSWTRVDVGEYWMELPRNQNPQTVTVLLTCPAQNNTPVTAGYQIDDANGVGGFREVIKIYVTNLSGVAAEIGDSPEQALQIQVSLADVQAQAQPQNSGTIILPDPPITTTVTPLTTSGALSTMFETQTGQTADNSFSAWVTKDNLQDLYIGVSNLPGHTDGGVIARLQQGNLLFDYSLSEQGVADIEIIPGSTIFVPGADPAFGDDWSAGNLYIKNTGTWSKIRNSTTGLVNVIHALGILHDSGTLFIATGSHAGDNQTWIGQVFVSSTNGSTWDNVYDVSTYRVYDIIKRGATLYGVELDTSFVRRLIRSDDNGATWTQMIASPNERSRLVVFNNLIVGVMYPRSGVFSVDGSNTITYHNKPSSASSIDDLWNPMATDGTYLYLLTYHSVSSQSRIWRTQDLTTWDLHAELGTRCSSISYWPNNGLVVSEQGVNARLLLVS